MTTDGGVTFDAETHTYRRAGVVLPSVTTILAGVRLVDFSRARATVLQAARERGSAVHAAVQYDTDGTLDDTTVDDAIRGYVEAARAWRLDCHVTPIAVEYRVFHPTYAYAGTPDLIGWLDGQPAVVDWKTGRATDAVADLQLAAYAAALRYSPPPEWFAVTTHSPIQRIAVELHENGTYRAHRYTRPTEFALFLQALSIYREQERRGVRECVA